MTRQQVFDLPPIEIRVTEHQLGSRRCGVITTADAPDGVGAPVQYGPQISAVMVYLYMGQYLSKARTATAMSELFNTPVSDGTVSVATARVGGRLDGFAAAVKAQIVSADVVHFDETGFRVARKLHWLHSASTPKFTMITCHRRRGREAKNAAGIIAHFTDVGVHDAWAPYDTYPRMTHALCNAHLHRELIAVTDHHARSTDPASWCWVAPVIGNLLAIKTMTDTDHVDLDLLATHRTLMMHAALIDASSALPGPLGAKHRALARRIKTRIEDYLRFATDPLVPWDNNAAEREIRMAKLRQKVFGAMRILTAPNRSQPYAATSPPPQNTTSTATAHSPGSPQATPGNP